LIVIDICDEISVGMFLLRILFKRNFMGANNGDQIDLSVYKLKFYFS